MTTYPTISAAKIIRPHVDVPVFINLPGELPEFFIRVDCSPPVFNTLVTSLSTVIVQAYGPDNDPAVAGDTQCLALLRKAARALEDHFITQPEVVSVEIENAPYPFPDPDRPGRVRWQFTAEMIQEDHP